VVLVRPDGTVLASSDPTRFPSGSRFPPAGDPSWGGLLARAGSGERDAGRLSAQPAGGLALGAYPIFDLTDERPLAVVALARAAVPPTDPQHLLARALAVFGIASVLVVGFSS